MEVAVLNKDGSETGKKVSLSADVFGIDPSDHAIYLDVKQIMANKRQGTHKAKERGEIKGSTRKLRKQKGSGAARIGSIKSPIFVGGGRIFGPRPRNYGFKLNKKVKQLARKSALSYKAQDNAIIVLEDFSIETPKTKAYSDILNSLNVAEGKTLMITTDYDKSIYLSSRNLSNTKVMSAKDLNTYDILNANKLILVEGSVKVIEESFKSE